MYVTKIYIMLYPEFGVTKETKRMSDKKTYVHQQKQLCIENNRKSTLTVIW